MLVIFSLVEIEVSEEARAGKNKTTMEYGCMIEPQKPEIFDGKVVTPVRLECGTDLEEREVVTELQQRRSGGPFESVPGSRLIFEAPEPITGDETIIEHSASGWPVQCRSIAGLQEFRTVVRIRAGNESSPRISSDASQLPQDCFGDEFKAVISQKDALLASACETAPITGEEVAASLKQPEEVAATPGAGSVDAKLSDALEVGILPESDLPVGETADAETVSALTELESEFVDCYNAGELRRAASLLAGEFQREYLKLTAEEGFPGNRFENPYPMPIDERISAVVRDARVFPDGRVGAIVEWVKASDGQGGTSDDPNIEFNFHVYERVGGEWRISDSIAINF